MKKLVVLVLALVSLVALGACVELEVSDVTSIELSWQPSEAYEVGENESLVGKAVKVNFADETSQTFQYGDANLNVSGSGYTEDGEVPYLVKNSVGEKSLRVSYGGVTVDVYYYVADIVVSSDDDPKSIIEDADPDDTVYISTGEYYISSNIELSTNGVSVIGPRYGTAKLTSNAQRVFLITGTSISVKNLTMTTGTHEGSGLPGIVEVRTGADHITIENNTIYSTYAIFTNYHSMDIIGINIKKADGDNYGSIDHLYIRDNTIYNVRQGIQLGYSGNGATAEVVVNSNNIFHTKGGILLWLESLDQLSNIERLDNSWESTVSGYRSHNECDMNYHTLEWTTEAIDYSANLTLSQLNNGAHIQDRRWCKYDGFNPNCTLGNGGGVPDNAEITPVDVEGSDWYVFDIAGDALNDINHPDAVYVYKDNDFMDGTRFNRTHMTIREYEENEFYDVSIDILTAENGNVREAIWVDIDGGSETQERAASIALAVTGLTPGGTIVEWINEQWATIDPSEYLD